MTSIMRNFKCFSIVFLFLSLFSSPLLAQVQEDNVATEYASVMAHTVVRSCLDNVSKLIPGDYVVSKMSRSQASSGSNWTNEYTFEGDLSSTDVTLGYLKLQVLIKNTPTSRSVQCFVLELKDLRP